jgi:sugar phosphate isomerase/epimerase
MRLGIFAKTFPGSGAATVLTAAKAAGYSMVQYNMACSGLPSLPKAISEDQAGAVADAVSATDVSIAAVSATHNMIHPDPAVRAAGQASLEVIAAAAHRMGTRLLTLCTGTRDPHDQWRRHPENNSTEAWRDLLASMESVIGIAERYDIDLGIEPERANVVDSAAKALRVLDELKCPRLKIVLDPANLVETEPAEEWHRIIASAVDLLAGDIVMAHAKDRAADGSFATAGAGAIDFPHYLRRLLRAGFDGPLVTHGLHASEAPGVRRFLAEALAQAEGA